MELFIPDMPSEKGICRRKKDSNVAGENE